MKKNNKFFLLISIFLTFFKIGLFTFGGGYAMIPLIQKEVVEKKKWTREPELLDIIAISESTPGPIAINAATYIGYQKAGILGSIFATLGVALPSFIIIFLISLIYSKALSIPVINAAFKGIRIAVIVLLVNAIFKLSKSINKSTIGFILFLITLITMLMLSFFNVTIQNISLAFIGLGLICGLVFEAIKKKGETK